MNGKTKFNGRKFGSWLAGLAMLGVMAAAAPGTAQALEETVDFSTCATEGTNPQAPVKVCGTAGIEVRGLQLNGSAWNPANLWVRTEFLDYGFGVCAEGENPEQPGTSFCITQGGDSNELDNDTFDGPAEALMLVLPDGYEWVSVQISSLDDNGGGTPERGQLWRDADGVPNPTPGFLGSLGDLLWQFEGGSVPNYDQIEPVFNIPADSRLYKYLVFEAHDFVGGTTNNDYLVYAATVRKIEKASLGDFVWEDCNGNGQQDDDGNADCSYGGGIPNVLVTLGQPDGNGNCVAIPGGPTDFTGLNGEYAFTDLEPGSYCVIFDKTTAGGTLGCEANFTAANKGDDASDSDANAAGATGGVSLAAGDNDTTLDAGLYCPASLGDFVWVDTDRDGFQDNGESGIKGVSVQLLDCESPAQPIPGVPNQVTNDVGFYQFTNLAPGCYTVMFTRPSGYDFTIPNSPSAGDAADSDADPGTGKTGQVQLSSGEYDPTVDAGVYPVISKLGDFVWEDCNGNGQQDDAGAANCPRGSGISDVPVTLGTYANGVCTPVSPSRTTATGANGYYEFTGLVAGSYCVVFDISAVQCTYGQPAFTLANNGNDASDSDAGAGGATAGVSLSGLDSNLTLDAGVVCGARLGDRVWNDDTDNDGVGNGLQDAGEPGINGVTVTLLQPGTDGNCGTGDDITVTSMQTSGDGNYAFDVKPGVKYCVGVDLPAGKVFTTQNAGDDAKDSDVNPVTGVTGQIMVPSNTFDRTWDAGVTAPPPCGITLDKSCSIYTPPASQTFTCDGKIDALTLKSDGLADMITSVVAYVGAPGSSTLPVTKVGDEYTVSGYQTAGAPNDVTWRVTFTGGNVVDSVFHLSCSDNEMDGETDDPTFPNDCARPEGDGKSNDSGTSGNIWLLEGLKTGSGNVLDCTVDLPDPEPTDCGFEAQRRACGPDFSYKPEMLTFVYSGGDCLDSDFAMPADKVKCTDFGTLGSSAHIVTDGGFMFDVVEGETFTVKRDKADKMWIYSADGGTLLQQLEIHTSCSQVLQTGDVFGGVTLIGMDGVGLGAEVEYAYLVANLGTGAITDVKVTDNLLGDVGSVGSLGVGDSRTFFKKAFITETTENTGTATAKGVVGAACKATDSAKVTVTGPAACSVTAAFEKIEDDKIKFQLTNTSGYEWVTLETFVLNYPENLYGLIKEIKLDGTIYKLDDYLKLHAEGKGSGDLIVESDWTQSDITKRQLYPGETRTLEIVFKQKYNKDKALLSWFSGNTTYNDGECSVSLVTK